MKQGGFNQLMVFCREEISAILALARGTEPALLERNPDRAINLLSKLHFRAECLISFIEINKEKL